MAWVTPSPNHHRHFSDLVEMIEMDRVLGRLSSTICKCTHAPSSSSGVMNGGIEVVVSEIPGQNIPRYFS